MSEERRYDEKEIAAIFARATKELEASRKQRLTGEGLSLAELKAIGSESGIPSELIARAAFSLDHDVGDMAPKTWFGFPIHAARTLELPRRLTEAEWEDLIVDLRSTFNARGKIEQDGSFRQWTNGNLQFLLEPMGEGSRLRMKTTKGNAKASILSAVLYVVLGLTVLLGTLNATEPEIAVQIFLSILTLVGFGMLGGSKISLPRWAKERQTQMATIEARLVTRMGVSASATSTTELNVADVHASHWNAANERKLNNQASISLDEPRASDERTPGASRHKLRS